MSLYAVTALQPQRRVCNVYIAIIVALFSIIMLLARYSYPNPLVK